MLSYTFFFFFFLNRSATVSLLNYTKKEEGRGTAVGLGPTTSWPQPVLALSERKGSEGGDPGIRQGRDGQGRMT